jgi:CheY-like chemotaxis protein
MDNLSPDPITVLFVDDDPSFLDTVSSAFTPLCQNQWHLLLAHDTATAINLLQSQPVHLAVLDVRMPGTNGLQLLQLLASQFPHLPKVFLTSATDASTRLAGLEAGANLFLEKPASLSGMESVFATLNELVKWHRKQPSNTSPRHARLIEIVRLECASGNSRLIHVTTTESSGLVYIKEGSILHAECPGRRGQSAFTFLASHPDAEFILKEFVEPPERSVTRQWEFLVLEAFQLREQLTQAAQEAKRKESTLPSQPKEPSPSQTNPLQAIAAATPTRSHPSHPAPPIPAKLRLAPAGKSPSTPRPQPSTATSPPTPTPTPPAPEPLVIQTAPAPLTLGIDVTTTAPQIEEILVATHQNEVLYEWRCARTDIRFRCLDGLRQRATVFSQRLHLEPTKRIEFQSTDSRLVVQFNDTSTLLVRSNTKQRPLASTVPPFNQPATEWLSAQSRIPGLLACGLVRANSTLISCSYVTELPSDLLNTAWRASVEVFDLMRDQHLSPWLIRWIFDRSQLYWIKRLDGRTLGLLLSTNPAELDASGPKKMFLEFSSLLES